MERNEDEMTVSDYVDRLHADFVSMEKNELVLHNKTRLHSFGVFVLMALANPKSNGSQEALDAILKKREH